LLLTVEQTRQLSLMSGDDRQRQIEAIAARLRENYPRR
jgi:hypothetical protein